MGTEQKTHFKVDKSKCIQCGKCVNTCSGMVITFGKDGYPEMKEFERYGWRGCWRCQHCLAVCPVGAISIFDKEPEVISGMLRAMSAAPTGGNSCNVEYTVIEMKIA